ncbi:MAG: lipopolysaccharide kinase InaA family protein [Caldimonas sp.]
MILLALSCPQCGGPLPRQALWRTVVCPHCRSSVTRASDLVQRAGFRAAWQRSQAAAGEGRRVVQAADARYDVLRLLGHGSASDVYLGRRLGPLASLVTLKIARDDGGAASLASEARHLQALQALDGAGAAYFSRRLPQLIHSGQGSETSGEARSLSVFRQPPGYWGSLAAMQSAQPAGVDARHVVWMWRRVLELLSFVHRGGWSHGDLVPDHLLVHPGDHGILLIGWSRARFDSGSAATEARSRDLAQLAWAMRSILRGASTGAPDIPAPTPAALAALLLSASEDAAWQAAHDADDVEQALTQAANASFGPPRFVPFDPLAVGGIGPS